MRKIDEDIKKAISHGTDSVTNKKDSIWESIQSEMEINNMSNKRKPTIIKRIGLIAAVTIIVGGSFVAFTPAGQASFTKFIELFAPEKPVEIEIEGESETGNYELHTNEVATPEPTENVEKPEDNPQKGVSYAIYVDKEHYDVLTEDGIDKIVPKDYPEDLPEVSLEIRQVTDKDAKALSTEILDDMRAEYETVYDVENVDTPVKGIMLRAHDGDNNAETKEGMPQWNSPSVKSYLVDNGDGGTFVITIKCFIEAEEGHGARLQAILNEFTIVPVE